MTPNHDSTFEDNTVFRLNKDIFHETDKIYLGVSLFDVPESMQDYIIIDVTNVVNKGHKARVEFVTDAMRTKAHVYRRYESMIVHDVEEKNHLIELDTNSIATDMHKNRQIENGCTCQDLVCSCCRHMKVRKVRLNDYGELLLLLTATQATI